MRRILKLVDAVTEALLFVAAVAILAMMLNIVLDVGLKYLSASSIPATLELTTYWYMPGCALLAMPYVQRKRANIVVELFTQNLTGRHRAAMDAVVYAFCFLYLAGLAWATFNDAVEYTVRREAVNVVFFDLPTWPTRWALPFSFATGAFYFLLQGVADASCALTGRRPETGAS